MNEQGAKSSGGGLGVAVLVGGLAALGLLLLLCVGGVGMLFMSRASHVEQAQVQHARDRAEHARTLQEAQVREFERSIEKQKQELIPAEAVLQQPRAAESLLVDVDGEGAIAVDGKSLSIKELQSLLAAERQRRGARVRVTIRAATECPLEKVTRVVNAVGATGQVKLEVTAAGGTEASETKGAEPAVVP